MLSERRVDLQGNVLPSRVDGANNGKASALSRIDLGNPTDTTDVMRLLDLTASPE